LTDAVLQTLKVSLSELLEGSSLVEVCQSYFDLFEVPIRAFDQAGKLLAEVAHLEVPCAYIDEIGSGRIRCTQTRQQAMGLVPREGEPAYVDCLFGLRYAVAPIVFQKGIAGKIILGPYLPAGLKRLPDEALSLAGRLIQRCSRKKSARCDQFLRWRFAKSSPRCSPCST